MSPSTPIRLVALDLDGTLLDSLQRVVHFPVLQLVRAAGGGHGSAVVVRHRQL